jgi:predicted ABC-type sugar transport system permease subunit
MIDETSTMNVRWWPSAHQGIDWVTALSRYGTVIALMLLCAGFSIARPDVFATRNNILSILNEASILVIVSMGLTVCLIMGSRASPSSAMPCSRWASRGCARALGA